MPSRTLRNYATFARLLLPAALALLASCAGSEHSAFYTVSTQPANVGDAGIAARAYHDSGAYDRDLAIVANQAARWITKRAANARRPALVLDIDETALSNWEIIKLDDFGRPIKGPCNPGSGAPCGWAAWDQLGRDPAIESALQVFRTARTSDVAVFFITGRPESHRAATERNLRLHYHRQYGRSALRPARWSRRKEISSARPILPRTLKLSAIY